MINGLILGLMMVSTAHANDYLDGRNDALNAQANAMATLGQINPNDYVNQYTEHPAESGIDPHSIEAAGRAKATTDEVAQQIIANEQTGDHVSLDLNSDEMNQTGQAIEGADVEVGSKQIPCHDGTCLPLSDEPGDDFSEGVTQLGALGGVSDEVRSIKNSKKKRLGIFSGLNAQCRTVVKPIGSCCNNKAHLMRCSKTEKALAIAKKEHRAFYVGTYCVKKVIFCLGYKESWCMFPTKLSSIIQIQGRYGQLHINFGKAKKDYNEANCRGITPKELQRIDFQKLDLRSLTEEYKARGTPKDSGGIDSKTKQKVEQMEREGRHHG
ncbi:conjugative transfer protein TraN [Legionella santicrucis]|uniref:Conjugative transfer protein TraN n=1 Tax=Legionella santicrucis TaxID=45074 RepID=A0A0W0ZC00_9GAMM|nr:conjugal transfer protein TraN [Legionella santicrucis]KTD66474.1 conjugative transfer protein TraN [Legionella santicrucis]